MRFTKKNSILAVVVVFVTAFLIYYLFTSSTFNTFQKNHDSSSLSIESDLVNQPRSDDAPEVDLAVDNIALPGTDELIDQSEEALRLNNLRNQVPVTLRQKERVENVSKESTQELIQNIANFDDYHFAITATGRRYSVGDPQSEMSRIIHTIRVRRLLEHGRNSPEQVIPFLREALATSFRDWPAAFEEHVELWKDNPNGFSQEEPTQYDVLRTQAIASAYLLAELGDSTSIPLLLNKYSEMEAWSTEHKPYPAHSVPVPPTTMLYAMHRLIEGYPAQDLGSQAITHQQQYLEWSIEHLKPVRSITVSAGSSEIDTTDPAVRLIDPAGRLQEQSETLNMNVYPHNYTDGARIESWDGPYLNDRGKQWVRHIRSFVDSLDK